MATLALISTANSTKCSAAGASVRPARQAIEISRAGIGGISGMQGDALVLRLGAQHGHHGDAHPDADHGRDRTVVVRPEHVGGVEADRAEPGLVDELARVLVLTDQGLVCEVGDRHVAGRELRRPGQEDERVGEEMARLELLADVADEEAHVELTDRQPFREIDVDVALEHGDLEVRVAPRIGPTSRGRIVAEMLWNVPTRRRPTSPLRNRSSSSPITSSWASRSRPCSRR